MADATRVLFNLLLLKKILLKSNIYLNGVIVHNRHKSTIAICEVIITFNEFKICEHKIYRALL